MLSIRYYFTKRKFIQAAQKIPGVWLFGNKKFYDGLITLSTLSSNPSSFLKHALERLMTIPEKSRLEIIENDLDSIYHLFIESGIRFESGGFTSLKKTPVETYSELVDWIDTWCKKITFLEFASCLVETLKLYKNTADLLAKDINPGIHIFGDSYNRLLTDLKYLVQLSTMSKHYNSQIIILNSTYEQFNLRLKNLKDCIVSWRVLYEQCCKIFKNYENLNHPDSCSFWFVNPVLQFIKSPAATKISFQRLKKYLNEIKKLTDQRQMPRIHVAINNPFPAVYCKKPELGELQTLPEDDYERSFELISRAETLLNFSLKRFMQIEKSDFSGDDFRLIKILKNPSMSTKEVAESLNALPKSYRYAEISLQLLSGNFSNINDLSDYFGTVIMGVLKPIALFQRWMQSRLEGFPRETGSPWVKDSIKTHIKNCTEKAISDISWDKNFFMFLAREPDLNTYLEDYVTQNWDRQSERDQQEIFLRLTKKKTNQIVSKLFHTYIKRPELFDHLIMLLNAVEQKSRSVIFISLLKSCAYLERHHIIKLAEGSTTSALESYLIDISKNGKQDLIYSKNITLCDLILSILPSTNALIHIPNEMLESICRHLNENSDEFSLAVKCESLTLFLKRGFDTEYLSLYFHPEIQVDSSWNFSKSQWKLVHKGLQSQNKIDLSRLESVLLRAQVESIPGSFHDAVLILWKQKGEQFVAGLNLVQVKYLEMLRKFQPYSNRQLAALLFYAHKFFSNQFLAPEVPDEVLQI